MASRARHRKYQTESTREKIRVSYNVNRLQDFIDGKVELSQSQVKAISILLDKSLPSLSSVDQTVEQVETRSEEDMMVELKEMIAKNPSLAALLRPN
jgi:hypothetical protein